jgi:cytochrome c peroxidase
MPGNIRSTARSALVVLAVGTLGTGLLVHDTTSSAAQGRAQPTQIIAPQTAVPGIRGVRAQRPSTLPPPLPLAASDSRQVDAWWAQFGSLKDVTPVLPITSDYIVDPLAAQQLGKALFWDTQAGQDGVACASCHFHAGADLRTQNQVNPGIKAADIAFSSRSRVAQDVGLIGRTGPNVELTARDFPLRQLADPNDRASAVLFDTNDVVSSQGAFQSAFTGSTQALDQAQDRRNRLRDSGQPLDVTADAGDGCAPNRDFFHRIGPNGSPTGDLGGDLSSVFANGPLKFRYAEPRHTPTTVNAVFNRRQFWDGRANSVFNGVDPYGPRAYAPAVRVQDGSGVSVRIGNPQAAGTGILVLTNLQKGALVLQQPLIDNASLASQAVAINTTGNGGIPLNPGETRCANSSFADLGRRLLDSQPLATQIIHPEDSLFGDVRTPTLVNAVNLPGLNTTYTDLIRKAFKPEYWAADGQYRVDGATGQISRTNSTGDDSLSYTQIEHNFSLFWGLAIQAYEQLLISDNSPFDRGPGALTTAAARGLEVFVGAGQCSSCHSGPLFTTAAVTASLGAPTNLNADKRLDAGLLGDGYPALFDAGFANTGVRPTAEDRGLGGRDPYGFDLSASRQYKWRLLNQTARAPDVFEAAACNLSVLVLAGCQSRGAPQIISAIAAAPRDAVDGAFKIPTLRNVGLTAPYFHNGGQATLKDVVRFYNRGGDRRGPLASDSTGLEQPTPFGTIQPTNLAPGIGDNSKTIANNALGLSEENIDDLVQFLLSLTDDRVACHADVFDHPELPLVLGHRPTPRNGTTRAKDVVTTLPAVGKRGLLNCFPNTGDLFGTANTTDPRKLQDIVTQKLR